VIGLELGSVWQPASVRQVTVVGNSSTASCPALDGEVDKQFQAHSSRSRALHSSRHKVTGVDTAGKTAGGPERTRRPGGKLRKSCEADIVMVAIGRVPYTEGPRLEGEAGPSHRQNHGRVQIDRIFAASVKGGIAIGADVGRGDRCSRKGRGRMKASRWRKSCRFKAGHVNYGRFIQVWCTTSGNIPRSARTEGGAEGRPAWPTVRGKFPSPPTGRFQASTRKPLTDL